MANRIGDGVTAIYSRAMFDYASGLSVSVPAGTKLVITNVRYSGNLDLKVLTNYGIKFNNVSPMNVRNDSASARQRREDEKRRQAERNAERQRELERQRSSAQIGDLYRTGRSLSWRTEQGNSVTFPKNTILEVIGDGCYSLVRPLEAAYRMYTIRVHLGTPGNTEKIS